MHRDLSHGLPELLTRGNQVLRADSLHPILLRGVNRSGLEYSSPQDNGFLAAAQFTEDEMREMVLNWRCNVIRIPFNQSWALHDIGGYTAGDYLAEIDRVISWASALDAYTILDLQWLDSQTVYGHITDKDGRIRENHVPPTPNPESILLWKTLAERYRDEPAVIFDLLMGTVGVAPGCGDPGDPPHRHHPGCGGGLGLRSAGRLSSGTEHRLFGAYLCQPPPHGLA
jgi:hypothetical protein